MMNKKTLLAITLAIALTWFLVWFFSNDKELMQRNKTLIKQRDSIISVNKQLSLKNDSLVLLKQKEVVKYVKIQSQLNTIKDETKRNINNVYLLNERQIDSTIRNHKHTIRN